MTYWHYLGSGDFWEGTTGNWQSEFLAVFSLTVLSISLRQKGSAESKRVGTPNRETGGE